MISDSSEYTTFSTFANDGIKTTDTFNSWRKKTNGLVQLIGLLEANSADSASPIVFDATNITLRIKTDGIKTINLENLSVTGEKIANLTITDGKLAANSVTESKISTGAVTESKIGSLAVTEGKLGTGSVTTVKLGNQAVTETKIGTGAVTADKIGSLAVTESKIGPEAVTETKIGFRAVTTDKLGTQAVTTPKIQDLSVVETKLADLSVTTAKIGAAAVSEAKIQNGAVTTAKIGANAVTANKLDGSQTGTAPVFGARAWARVKPYVGNNVKDTSQYKYGTYSRDGAGCEVTITNHGFRAGDRVFLRATTGSMPSELRTVLSVINANKFNINASGSATSGNIEAHLANILKSGNVHSITFYESLGSTPRYVVNFLEPMPTNDYSMVVTAQLNPGRWWDYGYDDGITTDGSPHTTTQCYLTTYQWARYFSFVIYA